MLPSRRLQSLQLLREARPQDLALCREVEAECHAVSVEANEYLDHVSRAAFNLRENPHVGVEVVRAADHALTTGTLLGRIQEEQRARKQRFAEMLQEKYDALNDRQFEAIVRCRRCGSTEVAWDTKQTRSADEAATVFCSCTTCKNRWVMR